MPNYRGVEEVDVEPLEVAVLMTSAGWPAVLLQEQVHVML